MAVVGISVVVIDAMMSENQVAVAFMVKSPSAPLGEELAMMETSEAIPAVDMAKEMEVIFAVEETSKVAADAVTVMRTTIALLSLGVFYAS